MANKITNTDNYTAIANAIRSKNGSSDTYTPSQMATAISNIQTGVSLPANTKFGYSDYTVLQTLLPDIITASSDYTNFERLFYQCTAIGTFDVSNLDISHSNKLSSMFERFENPTVYYEGYPSLDIYANNWSFANDTSLNSLFAQAGNASNHVTLHGLDTWDTSNVSSMNNLFYVCNFDTSYLQDVTNWDVSNVSSMQACFSTLSSITSLDLSGWTFGDFSINANSMFHQCTSLMTLDISGMDLTKITNYNSMFGGAASARIPTNCLIYVKDQASLNWMNTNFSWLTNVQIKQ